MARLIRQNELSTTKIYSISDYSSSLTAKCADYTYLSEISSNSTATSGYLYTGSTSGEKIATYSQFKVQALTASTFDIYVNVMLGNEAGGPCTFIVVSDRISLTGKYFVPMCISGSSYNSYQANYPYNYSGKLFMTGVIRCSNFSVNNEYISTPYGYFINGVNVCQQTSLTTNAGTSYFNAIGQVSNVKFCGLSGTSKTADSTYNLYHETRLYYTEASADIAHGICFGNYSSGDYSYYGVMTYSLYGYMTFKWLNSGTNAHSGPGLYWEIPSSGSSNIYIKAHITERTYSGTKVTLKGNMYMPINIFFNAMS